MRITQRAVALTSLQGLNRNLDAVGKLQQQLTSGRLINAPSDSPTGTNRAMQARSDQAATAQQSRNINDAKSWLEQTDSSLQEMLSTARRIRDLTVQGSNTGSNSDVSAQAIATEVSSLRDGLLSLANRSIGGRPLFGGVTPGSKAYDAAGTYVGQVGPPVTRRVSDTEVVQVDTPGPQAFGPAGADIFAIADKIATDVVANPTALAGHLADLDVVMKGMLTAVADVGSRAARVDREDQVNSDRALTLSSRLAETENIDLPNTIMQLQMQKVGYEAALAATAKALTPTLLDYLR
ncbi:flagellar hook-associated protein FlgL [Blastococcus sp. CT_GayMR16]|uniref:flagellar hook-associated protein FlgL n=1 Tax=Blastococcus sp. CT_GayMR16 TaxID=2559607 RepID=UPI00107464C2|nr:flagellar hook-associated protein FlgL [Blastococcus sp. CT_GayMR16]TFV83311.1 flagellar hook-associated protein 3 [Blastococcus sp. CT_GayMR16]